MMTLDTRVVRPAGRLRGLEPYTPPSPDPTIDLRLDANEGPPVDGSVARVLASLTPEDLRRYPDTTALERRIASSLGIEPSRVVLTNGGDDAIDRVCRCVVEPGRVALLHTPTFVMIERGVRLSGGDVRSVNWVQGDFPTTAFCDAIDEDTALVSLVTPNNPTGEVVDVDSIRRIVERASQVGALVMIDLAYVEFAECNPIADIIDQPNVVVVRTFSKAQGLAGARVGYAIASEQVARWMRTVGAPYPVSAVSLALANAALDQQDARAETLQRVVRIRDGMIASLNALGIDTAESQANFICPRVGNPELVRRGLASLGISARGFAISSGYEDRLRITVQGNPADAKRVIDAVQTCVDPEAILFDLDGVLADVSGSYRRSIIETAGTFGVSVSQEDIEIAKRKGDANNDWILTRDLLTNHGVEAPLADVTARFQEIYAGADDARGLCETERLIPDASTIRRLAAKRPLAIVTGRPFDEAEWFLERFDLLSPFGVIVGMEDAPAKPSPEPVTLAMSRLGVSRCWMIGDTPDDAIAARRAGVMPIGYTLQGDASRDALVSAGCATILNDLSELERMLP